MSRHDVETLARHLDARAPSAEVPAEVRELAALARSIETRAVAPRPQFHTDLRAMLLAEAAAGRAPAWRERVRGFVEDTLAGWRATGRQVAVAGVAALVLVVAGLGVATNMAVPGDFLHTVKVRLEDQRIERAETLSQRGTLLLQSASTRIDEAERSAAGDRPASAGLALEAADVRTRDGAQALLSAALTGGDRAPVAALERFSTDHRPRVEALAATLRGDPAQSARNLLTTLERIDARLEAQATGCCGVLAGVTVGGLTDLTTIPPADQPFRACPCVPAGAAADLERFDLRRAPARGEPEAEAGAPVPRRPAQRQPSPEPTGGADPPGSREAPGIVDRARDTAEDGVDGAVDGVTGAVKEAAGDATGAVTGTTDDLRERVDETLDDPVGTVTETVEEAGGMVEDAVDEADDVADDVTDVVEDVTGAVDDAGDTAGGLLP